LRNTPISLVFLMHTVASARAWAIDELKRCHVESPVLTADILLGFVLGWDRVRVLSHPEHSIREEAWAGLQDMVCRRARGEPVQYLTGEREFYGLVFRVTPEVLIPRPETELMVEKAIDLIRNSLNPQARFLDVGTGSGCIAISVAREVPSSIGWAVDLSKAALLIARENAAQNDVAERILLVQADLLECFPRKPLFDFILCNPPYIPLHECDSLPAEVRDHEPHRALFGGESGFEVYGRLIPEVSTRLAWGGYLLLEVGAGQDERVGQLVEEAGLCLEMTVEDLRGIPRCIVGRKLLRRNERNGQDSRCGW
jgi:release factor glutamine methyltransferase